MLPRYLFASDGSLLLAYYKSSMLHHLEKLSSNVQQAESDSNWIAESDQFDNIVAATIELSVMETNNKILSSYHR